MQFTYRFDKILNIQTFLKILEEGVNREDWNS